MHIYNLRSIVLILLLAIVVTLISTELSANINLHENYDAVIQDISSTECGTKCTNATNCHGFGYKPNERKCYLSKTGILGKPSDSLYANEYSILDRRCNKMDYLTVDNNRYINDETLVSNSLYMCSDGAYNFSNKFQYANNGASSLGGQGKNKLRPSKVRYDVVEITWPKSVTDKISENVIYKSNSAVKNQHNDYQSKNTQYIDKNKDTHDEEYGYIESDLEFLGQYMLPHQCTTKVPLFDCLRLCDPYKNCVGVEWNDGITMDNGTVQQVCCPKTIVSKIIPRREQFKNGKFYLKQDIDKLKNRNRIVIARSVPSDFSFK